MAETTCILSPRRATQQGSDPDEPERRWRRRFYIAKTLAALATAVAMIREIAS